MAVAERSGLSGDVPEPDDRRTRCWRCREWYTWPVDERGRWRSGWPQFCTDNRFVGCQFCESCAATIFNKGV